MLFFIRLAIYAGVLFAVNGCIGEHFDDDAPANTPTQEKEQYDYIPKQNKLSDAMAIRFLNKATFGATRDDVKTLREKGVVSWLNAQLKMPLRRDQYLTKTIQIGKEARPDQNPHTVDEYLADNDMVFNKNVASFHSPTFMQSAWFDVALTSKDQLRHKVAYALSQIIVESDFEPIFTRRGEALARYFDLLADNAFGTYQGLLTDISFSSGMGLFLTFNGNKALHENKAHIKVYPDENYAREIMQLFSIGLNELNMDATPKKDANGNLIPTYTQNDVNELARVFTGWDLKRNDRYGVVGFTRGDFTHPLRFTLNYHDTGQKHFLGHTIPAGLTGEEDIKSAIDIIMANPNVAPYISKNLIMRLAKSNPTPGYVQRVSTVFRDSGGDLKKVTKAILLDPELWSDIKALKSIKFKEPLIAFTQLLRVGKVKPLPYWYFCGYGAPKDDDATNCTRVHNKFLFNSPKYFLGQGAGRAPTVFNFYDNSYIPNDASLKRSGTVAPELQIQDDSMLINYSNEIRVALTHNLTSYLGKRTLQEIIDLAPKEGNIPLYYIGSNKFTLDLQEDYDFLEMRIDGNKDGDFKELKDTHQKGDIAKINGAVREYIDFVDNKLTGGLLTQKEKATMYQTIVGKDGFYNHWAGDDSKYAKIRQVFQKVISPLYRAIATSDKYMVE